MEEEDVGEESVVLINVGNKKQSMTDQNSDHSKSMIKPKSTTKFKMNIMKRLQRGNFLKRAPIFLVLLILMSGNHNSEAFTTKTTNEQTKLNSQVSSSPAASTSSSSTSPYSPSQQSSPSQQANRHNGSPIQEISPSINLIPVDQPMISERSKQASTSDDTSRSSSLSDSSADNLHSSNQHDSSSIAFGSESSTSGDATVGLRNSLGSDNVADFIQENVASTGYNEASADSQAVEKKHQHQHQVEDYIQQAVYSIPDQFVNKFEQNKHSIQQQQQKPFAVERRFGLLKKHYGTPMTANYATSGHYMSDCERCLFGLGAGQQQQSADLQQIDPPQPIAPILPPAPPLPPPQPTIIPAPQPIAPSIIPSNNFGPQSFSPLKNKFFMKFPFFMKPISFGSQSEMSSPLYNFGSTETVPYWYQTNQQHYHQQNHHHQQQPLARPNAALYIRPAYNCIQATPPLIASASNQHLSDVTTFSTHNSGHHSGLNSGALSATKGGNSGHTKQSIPFQQQQTTYSSSQY